MSVLDIKYASEKHLVVQYIKQLELSCRDRSRKARNVDTDPCIYRTKDQKKSLSQETTKFSNRSEDL